MNEGGRSEGGGEKDRGRKGGSKGGREGGDLGRKEKGTVVDSFCWHAASPCASPAICRPYLPLECSGH